MRTDIRARVRGRRRSHSNLSRSSHCTLLSVCVRRAKSSAPRIFDLLPPASELNKSRCYRWVYTRRQRGRRSCKRRERWGRERESEGVELKKRGKREKERGEERGKGGGYPEGKERREKEEGISKSGAGGEKRAAFWYRYVGTALYIQEDDKEVI